MFLNWADLNYRANYKDNIQYHNDDDNDNVVVVVGMMKVMMIAIDNDYTLTMIAGSGLLYFWTELMAARACFPHGMLLTCDLGLLLFSSLGTLKLQKAFRGEFVGHLGVESFELLSWISFTLVFGALMSTENRLRTLRGDSSQCSLIGLARRGDSENGSSSSTRPVLLVLPLFVLLVPAGPPFCPWEAAAGFILKRVICGARELWGTYFVDPTMCGYCGLRATCILSSWPNLGKRFLRFVYGSV